MSTSQLHDDYADEWQRVLTEGFDHWEGERPKFLIDLLHLVTHRIPSDPRCESCGLPFEGFGGSALHNVGYHRSNLNPRFCNFCDQLMKRRPGGAEVELTLLFVDVRGSTGLAETMGPTEFTHLMNRFYASAVNIIAHTDAIIDKLVGDEVIGLFVPGFAKETHAQKAIQAARELMEETGHGSPEGPWIPLGAGVHTGVAYVGTVGGPDSVTDITAMGDTVNTAARLVSQAATGEIVVSEASAGAAGLDESGLESRLLTLKGKSQPVPTRVIKYSTS
jgi:class 3 adenylate cyclase